ncbi:PTS lactose/cellobiose transporter subunit IIA [uncultured Enorma sp.]|uniref:PTS lactose/cellobiose transporter subunit IIA n=1 Tax=uncultured Enorma sp. TaxID=1714346 RepID=UPI0025941A96|nr:PTS lactose/cellobiose transporter subunit IIA [uncultured Enorma sp.]
MDETKYETAMQIIMHAGNAKSAALMAIDAAAEGNFEEAEAQLKEADAEMQQAHHVQFDLTQAEACGESVEVNIILVHAEDHLAMAIMAGDFARRFIALYKSMAE